MSSFQRYKFKTVDAYLPWCFSVQHVGSDQHRAAAADLQVAGWTGEEIPLNQLNICHFSTAVSFKGLSGEQY